MDRFSPKEQTKQKAPKVVKKKPRKNSKYITKIINGEKHMVMNPNYVYSHID